MTTEISQYKQAPEGSAPCTENVPIIPLLPVGRNRHQTHHKTLINSNSDYLVATIFIQHIHLATMSNTMRSPYRKKK